MSSKTNKRSNQDAESEPAAKRKAVADPEKEERTTEVSSNHLESISSAQEAFDRLDFKSAQEICTQLIDADPNNAKALILRSISRERTGQLIESVDDAEAAVKVKGEKNRKPFSNQQTYVRGAFAHLGRAKHLLQLALSEIEDEDGSQNQKDLLDSTKNDSATQIDRNRIAEESHSGENVIMTNGTELEKEIEPGEENQESWLQELNLEELIGGITTMQVKEVRSPFRRITSELFVRMASYCDSPSLVKSMAVCKSWNSSIAGSPNLFCQFKMEGSAEQITKGINCFSSRCNNSIQGIDLKVNDYASSEHLRFLKLAIVPSSETLKRFAVDHSGYLCQHIIDIAAEAPSLTTLSSYQDRWFNMNYKPSAISLILPTTWKPKLKHFLWNVGSSLQSDQRLLKALQEVEEVVLLSRGVKDSWVVKLLSSTPELEFFWLPLMEKGQEDVEEVPSLELPKLRSLWLRHAPKSRTTQSSNEFFKNLHAPRLSYLQLSSVDPKALSSLDSSTSLDRFDVSILEMPTTGGQTEMTASTFISSIKDWNGLRRLNLWLPGDTASAFYDRILTILSPLSKESVKAGYRDHLILPNLQELTLGRAISASACDPQAISGESLASFVASRKAVHRGLSTSNVMFSAMGDLEASSSDPAKSGEEIPFKDVKRCALMKSLDVEVLFEIDGATESWLKEEIQFKCCKPVGRDTTRVCCI